jgi:ABC-type branched-subunit amino acid transport system ATPase component/ABC-type branched-subunit amino acid transport system permease subunit
VTSLLASPVQALGFELPFEVVVLGVITGLAYALLGIGLTLTYRATGVINFAHGQLGALIAAMVPLAVLNLGLPYVVGLALAAAAAVALGLLVDRCVFRPLAEAPRVLVLVATIALAQAIFFAELLIPRKSWTGYPTPVDWVWDLGGLRLGPGQVLLLLVGPLAAGTVLLLLQRSAVGVAARAAADNRRAALLTGIPVARISATVTVTAAVLAGVAAILVSPTQPVLTAEPQGPGLMTRGLAAAMLGGFTNVKHVFFAGISFGVIEALVAWNYPTGGFQEIVLLGLVLATLLVRKSLRGVARSADAGTSLFGRIPPLPRVAAADRRVVRARIAGGAVILLAAVTTPLALTSARLVEYSNILCFSVIGLSLVVLTGFAGQVSLGNFAFVGVGALVTGRMLQLGYPFWVAALYATLAGALAATLVGIPAVRVRGLYLAVATMAFAVAAGPWLTSQSWLVAVVDGKSSMQIDRPHLGSIAFADERVYAWFCLAALLLVSAVVAQLRRTGLGRAMLAVRDNPNAAAALGISPVRTRLIAFAISGAIAGFGGVLYGGLLVTFSSSARGLPPLLQPEQSLLLLSLVVVGGVTSVSGPVWGALTLLGGQYVLTPILGPLLSSTVGDNVGLLLAAIGVVATVIAYPTGIAGAVARQRDRLVARALRPAPETSSDQPGEPQPSRPRLLPQGPAGEVAPGPALEARDIVVRYGGILAVDHVSLQVPRGSIVGLVGPNGAGKSTLFDALSGQVRPTSGSVLLGGQDVSGLSVQDRARLGLGRTYQDARLFPDLVLRDVLKVARETRDPAALLPSLLALPPSRAKERTSDTEVTELMALLGLTAFADRAVGELSTGTRRLVELACMISLGAEVLLLDEPTAGLAQREAEAFVPVLREIRDHLDATVVIIDHDMPLIASVVDHLFVMATGELLAEGRPADVLADPRVVAAYLGTDERAISRSGPAITKESVS